MFNVILLPDERRKLERKGYYFLENKDGLILKNKDQKTLFELFYNNGTNILLLKDVCYYFTGLMFIEVSGMDERIHIQLNWYANRNDNAEKLEGGKFKKSVSWGIWISDKE